MRMVWPDTALLVNVIPFPEKQSKFIENFAKIFSLLLSPLRYPRTLNRCANIRK